MFSGFESNTKCNGKDEPADRETEIDRIPKSTRWCAYQR